MKKYQIAIYIRLSKEDDSLDQESQSITMQRLLLQRYVEENFADYDLSEFCDDGYTGTNFRRPGMQAMLDTAKRNELDCIIVKDFSRFARDYIELGSYLEQIFPFLGIRFISVNDYFDSADYQGGIAGLDVNFKNLLYDLYSKDMSGKVRSSLAVKKEKGQYISGNCPFGYEKAQNDRHALLIAEDEAEVVRRIYALTADGYTSVEIARLFNETRVKTPIEFKIEKGKTRRAPKGERFLWNSSTICQILRNEVYIGNIVQKKYTKDFAGGRNHLNPREDWLVTPGHHEPIIERELFDQVQKKRGKKKALQYHQTHPLTGKLVCGCCKKNLRCRTGLNPYFSCVHRYSNTMENCVGKVNAMFLEQYVLLKLQDQLQAGGELERLCMEEAHRFDCEMKRRRKERQLLSVKIEKLKQENFESYRNYVFGKNDHFQSNELMVKSMEEELAVLDAGLLDMEAEYRERKRDRELDIAGRFTALTRELVEHYIDKIVVWDEEHIEIQWNDF